VRRPLLVMHHYSDCLRLGSTFLGDFPERETVSGDLWWRAAERKTVRGYGNSIGNTARYTP